MKLVVFFIVISFSLSTYAEMDVAEIEKYEAFDKWVYGAFPVGSPTTEETILGLDKAIVVSEHGYSVGHAANPLKSVKYKSSGLEICAIVEQTPTKKAYITQITINSGEWVLSNGIAIGQNVSVLSKLPVSPHEGTLKYCGANNCINFQVKDKIIDTIKINLYAD